MFSCVISVCNQSFCCLSGLTTRVAISAVALDSRLEETPKIETESTGKRKAGTRPDEFEAGKSIKPGRLASDEDRKRWAIQGFTR